MNFRKKKYNIRLIENMNKVVKVRVYGIEILSPKINHCI